MARKRLTRQESKEQTRRDVVRAAGRLFLRDGFVATSLSAIADEAGVTKGAVYSNFESKEDLFLTIVQGDDAPTTSDALSVTRFAEHLEGRPPTIGFGALGASLAEGLPSARHVALFLEYNAFALRSTRSRAWVLRHNADYFEEMGKEISDVLDRDDGADIAAIAQSLYAGLLLHRSFDPDRFDARLFERAFRLLAQLVED